MLNSGGDPYSSFGEERTSERVSVEGRSGHPDLEKEGRKLGSGRKFLLRCIFYTLNIYLSRSNMGRP